MTQQVIITVSCFWQKEEVKTEAPQTQMIQFCPFLSTETEDSMVTSSSGKLCPPCLPGATTSAIWCSYGPNYVSPPSSRNDRRVKPEPWYYTRFASPPSPS
ncbi:hypothetical protein JOQ06_016991 [Pogonophryne albipinna]|uniref:Uncharacterized protein n=1 Tax=Pogonophryne albipinna TaxID=1090488 RepID=A0AAD6B3B9_9TELE|nr:hypothetical protein JOQ06_016991 [Pogonophryne albipinna]